MSPTAAASAYPDERPLRILVVDDDELVMASVLALLSGRYRVDGTLSAREGLERLSHGEHDVLIVDLMMAEMHGLELVREAKKISPELLAIVMTGYGTKQAAVEALQSGVCDFLEKPLTPELVLRTVERAWGARKAELELRELARRLGEELALKKARERERELEQELAQAEKFAALGELASGVAHEINNPLQIVSGYAEMLGTLPGTSERALDCVQRILKATDRACAIVSKLQAFSRRDFLELKPCAMNIALLESCAMLEPQLVVHNVRLIKDLSGDLPLVIANPAELEQIFTNLIINARDAMPDGGVCTVSTRLVEGQVEVRIEDTGTGMEPHLLEKIFNPFFSTKSGGSGLGLALVKNMLRRARGTIEVDSTPGVGTAFSLRFSPDAAASEAAARQAAGAPQRALKILVVDDEADIREICRTYLQAEQHGVDEATDGEDALARLASSTYDLLLMDVKMPGRGGLSVMREMHARAIDTPVILMTGVVRAAPETSALFPNLIAVLRKPFRRSELTDALARVPHRQTPTIPA
jgi:signal transduction histidine kinase